METQPLPPTPYSRLKKRVRFADRLCEIFEFDQQSSYPNMLAESADSTSFNADSAGFNTASSDLCAPTSTSCASAVRHSIAVSTSCALAVRHSIAVAANFSGFKVTSVNAARELSRLFYFLKLDIEFKSGLRPTLST
ncbi:uncharacterized protein LOC125423524 [Ziziphus jujuba]|uniref:Uncharacterized protein LOC125423524 n=1 Tax=Ziziphus jujuba TaxID=326968 RepID=A0ABM4A5C3_ZIZJJ|nr:uncharacterized protein LOC125423524 [Ziziphus jujuba]